jgi:uncharacterized protein YdeI (YjbR/CyaY-like superfamily)
MKTDVPELLFPTRAEFRSWLTGNAETSDGVWLIFGKTKAVATLSANDALEEALCFGWIDGQMKSLDDTKYRKYFARRRPKSPWSEKNKGIVEALRGKGLMTPLGEKAVEAGVNNGAWDAPKREPITEEQVAALAEKLSGHSPAYENFMNMPPSVKRTYTGAYLSKKSDEARQRELERIIGRLDQNLKPM